LFRTAPCARVLLTKPLLARARPFTAAAVAGSRLPTAAQAISSERAHCAIPCHSIVAPTTLPPSSLVLAYWMGGAFLMTVKRLAEYRTIVAAHGSELLGAYRRSFRYYTAERLLVLSFLCALLASFFIAIFLIKYRIEYLLSFPLFALLFATYLRLELKQGSNAQTPERLFEERLLMTVVAVLVVALAVLTVVDIPSLGVLSGPHYLHLL
jgi:4-hydroxybenzoate polyprenyltransferase